MQVRIDLVWPRMHSAIDDDSIAALYGWRTDDEPWLRINFVSSLDGAATHDGLSGDLGSDADLRVFDLLRRLCDVVLVGAGTVRSEGYGPMRLDASAVAWRRANGLQPHPVFAVVSRSLDLDPSAALFTAAPVRPLVFTTERADPGTRRALAAVADVLVCGADTVEADAMTTALSARGLNRIHCEGGPTFFGSLLAADRVDELCLTVSPRLESGDAQRIAHGQIPDARRMRLAHTLVAEDGTLLLRYLRN